MNSVHDVYRTKIIECYTIMKFDKDFVINELSLIDYNYTDEMKLFKNTYITYIQK